MLSGNGELNWPKKQILCPAFILPVAVYHDIIIMNATLELKEIIGILGNKYM